MDLFDYILEPPEIDTKYTLLQILEKNLPEGDIEIISKNGERICSKQKSFLDADFEKELWEKAKNANNLIYSEKKNNFWVFAWYFENMHCLLACSFLKISDLFFAKKMIPNIVMLCVEIFHKDQLLAEEKESLVIHKKQRDRKIQVLEKKYEDILIENQKQSAEYSKLLHSEIQRQTSKLKNSNKELKLAKKKAEAANRAKDAFLANMSHEIRTPLNSVLGFIELSLEDPSIKEDLHQHLSIAHNSAKGLLSLIDDILNVSKLERGKVVLEKKPFRLLELIKKTFDTMKIESQKKGLFLEYDIHPSVSGVFLGDDFRIRQIMINLIGNAIKFTEYGGVVLKILPGKKKDEIHFMVKDTGIGIPSDRLDTLFDPFEQADMSTTRRYGGTGLGTTISRQIVELMGGQIWAESEKGKGSIFHFIIQIESIDDKDIEGLDSCGELEKSEQKLDRSFKILLAEDTQANAILVKTRLERQGHIITQACNGSEAVEAFKKDTFDIILMDIHMPEMDGLEATAAIRSAEIDAPGHIPIIALTASVMGNEIKRFIAAGMDSVVAKPIDFKNLSMVMDKLVPKNKGVNKIEDMMLVNSFCESKMLNIKGVDYKTGLERWQDQTVYTKALIEFANQYMNFSKRFSLWLDTGDIEQSYQATHTLKGVAGNLAIIKVADIAGTINSALKKKKIKTAREQFVFLEAELNSTILSILELESRTKPDILLKKIDPDRISRLLQKITDAFNQYSPHAIGPLIQELETYIHQDQLKPVIHYSEELDFDRAKKELIKLAQSLHPD
ncbi:MAG: ATP-binding protein [Pseudomonadota bacterium]